MTTDSTSSGDGRVLSALTRHGKHGVSGGGGGGGYLTVDEAKAGSAWLSGVGAGIGSEEGKRGRGGEVTGVEEESGQDSMGGRWPQRREVGWRLRRWRQLFGVGQDEGDGEEDETGAGVDGNDGDRHNDLEDHRYWGEGGDGMGAVRRRASVREEWVTHEEKKKLAHHEDRCYNLEGEEETRCHANVFFFGVSKCGTTSLSRWMSLHPQILWVSRPEKKPGGESHVLDHMSSIDDHIYALTGPEATEADLVVDYTPHYSILPDVPYRIQKGYGLRARDGTIKYIVNLREPAARTVSSWEFKYYDGSMKSRERRSLVKAFKEGKKGIEKLVECRATHLLPAAGAGSNGVAQVSGRMKTEVELKTCNARHFVERNTFLAHVGKSVYHLRLEPWIRLFGRENVKVVFLEEMAADPLGTVSDVFDFLGMDLLLDDEEGQKKQGLPTRAEWEKMVKKNENATEKTKKGLLESQVTPELMQKMRDFYAPHNAQLETLLGRPLPENWSKS